MITASVMTLVIDLATAGMVKATWAERSPVLRSLPSSLLALVAELWMAQLWRLRAEQWQTVYWRDTEQLRNQIQQLRPQSKRTESIHLFLRLFVATLVLRIQGPIVFLDSLQCDFASQKRHPLSGRTKHASYRKLTIHL